MSNKENKPKRTAKELIEMMKNEKGITFNFTSIDEAENYLKNTNNYLRTAAYRKNYTKFQGGPNNGKYERLDFAYLQELSTIDMYLRTIISKMCCDIEHALKVKLINDIEMDASTDGYEIVYKFLKDNPYTLSDIAKKVQSTYIGDLIQKYFKIEEYNDNGIRKSEIAEYDDCPCWVLMELLSYGEFIKFYEIYYKENMPVGSNLLRIVKSLRNCVAHNNCMIANLSGKTSIPPKEIKEAVKRVAGVNNSQRQNNLSSRPMLEFVTMLYVYNKVVSKKIKTTAIQDIKKLFYERMLKHKDYFEKNELIISRYQFAILIIEGILS